MTEAKKFFNTKNIVIAGMFAAILAVISQISLPMPSGVPITIQIFGVALVGAVLGWKLGFCATVVYILIGAIGVPVFANFRGGLSVIMGMSGGYILAWPILALLCGITPKFENKAVNAAVKIVLALAGLLIDEAAGGYQWSVLAADQSFGAIMAYSFVAFIPKDTILTLLGLFLGRQVRKPLLKMGYIK